MMKRILLLVCIIAFTCACSIYHINSEEVTTNFHPPKESSSEVAHLENVSQAYEIVGFITVNSERNKTMEQIFAEMKREAAVLGGDAIIDIKSDATGSWKKIPPQKLLGNAYVRANFTGTIIAFE